MSLSYKDFLLDEPLVVHQQSRELIAKSHQKATQATLLAANLCSRLVTT